MYLKKNDRILFQGDSITNAFRRPEEVGTSYRLGAGWAMMAAARLQAEDPSQGYHFENTAVSGECAADLLKRWDTDCISLKPDVLSLLIGVNETIQQMNWGKKWPVGVYRENVVALLDRTRGAFPGIRIILCEPFLLETGDVTAAWLEDLAPRQAAVKELADEYGALFVPLQQRFFKAAKITGPDYWLFDGIHPNAPGQWLLMQAWLEAVNGAAR